MKGSHLFLLFLLFSVISFNNFAQAKQPLTPAKISVEKAYARATIPGTSISSAYMTIVNNTGKTVTLLGANSKISPRIEIHAHSMENGMMRMRKLDSIIIRANERIILQPSGLHLMLFDVKKPLQSQQDVNLTLHFSAIEPVSLQLPVYNPQQEKAAQNNDAQPSMMQHHH
jgi:copper(I)-binding protein